ncbi:hypothetical protein Q3G72_008679 [Acer saccharum]|nr:hypothetical protein Q3G72_008679 [Acer saccharum]
MPFRERVERYMKISESRLSYLKQINLHNRIAQRPNMMRPLVGTINGFVFLVELEIGDPLKKIYLIMDTGSSLTWIQCQPCKECFPQKFDIFDPKNSKTFKNITCDNPLCQNFNCIDQICSYTLNYMDRSFTQGYVALETFHIKDENYKYTHIKDVLFGCSISSRLTGTTNSSIQTGIMGLNTNPASFITQMGSFILRRFSYCLVDPFKPGTSRISYIKFGLETGYIGGAVQKTPFVKHPDFTYQYFVNLLDISVNNNRLNFPPDHLYNQT